jgi:prepilin-type N-terminal cleavage/methylation domain-containing protein
VKKGFTLIELLVVVLIIGVLAAVALPMYEKAVYKARMAEPLSMMKSIHQAMEVYYLANGEWPIDFEQLDITIPAGDWEYELGTYYGMPAEKESCEWPKLGQPRGWGSIAAWNTKIGGGRGKGAIFYSIPKRAAYNFKPGIYCCVWGGVDAEFNKFCLANKVEDTTVGSCYSGGEKTTIQVF